MLILLQCRTDLFNVSLVSNVTAARLFSAPIPTLPDNTDFFIFGFGKGSR